MMTVRPGQLWLWNDPGSRSGGPLGITIDCLPDDDELAGAYKKKHAQVWNMMRYNDGHVYSVHAVFMPGLIEWQLVSDCPEGDDE